MLKDTADIIASPLTCIVNLSLESGMVPTDWKVAVVTPLYKSGSHSEKGNYRPISVLPILSKILEKAVHAQVISYFETNNLFCKFQFGYRHKRSCELAVTHFVDSIRKDIDSGKYVGAVYIDLAKAFDTVSHSVILNKLQSYGIIENELTWFTDYLFQRKQYVKFDGSKSESDFVTCGVPQGSILGPLLFLIHYNDIETVLKTLDL